MVNDESLVDNYYGFGGITEKIETGLRSAVKILTFLLQMI